MVLVVERDDVTDSLTDSPVAVDSWLERAVLPADGYSRKETVVKSSVADLSPGVALARVPAPTSSAPVSDSHLAAEPETSKSKQGWLARVTLTQIGIGLAGLLVVFALLVVLTPAPEDDGVVSDDPTSAGAGGSETVSEAVVVTPTSFMGGVIPVSEQAGPVVFTEQESSGWRQDPLAAAIAAVHLSARSSAIVGPDMFTRTITTQTVGDSAELLKRRQAEYAELAKTAKVKNGAPIAIATNEIIGWRVPSWNETDPTVWLLVRQPQTTNYTRVEIPLAWDEGVGDWKLKASNKFANDTETNTDQYERFFNQGGTQ